MIDPATRMPVLQCYNVTMGGVHNKFKRMIYLLTANVIQSEAKNLGNTMACVNVDAPEILPPFGRLNDKSWQEVYR